MQSVITLTLTQQHDGRTSVSARISIVPELPYCFLVSIPWAGHCMITLTCPSRLPFAPPVASRRGSFRASLCRNSRSCRKSAVY